ncbi:MAG: DUF3696 domain-containing protein [Chloroflexi bacterium]|nr:DUF3696 domain-containing protein [Chloroflexota bacterium]
MLTQLELRSFKCFDILRLPLAQLTLLTGLNSAGKSSVLQALVLLHQTMREHEWSTRLALNGIGVRLGAVADVVDEQSSSTGFEIALEDQTNSYRWAFVGDRRDMSMQVQRVVFNDRMLEQPKELRYLLPLRAPDSVESLAMRIRNLVYVTAERLAPQDSYVLEDPHVVTDVGPRGEHALSVLHWGRDDSVPDQLTLPDVSPLRLRQVEARMGSLFPGFAIDLQQAPRATVVTLGLRTSEAEEFHRPVHTGFGLTQVLPVVVAALSAVKGDILLIENPEVHLHPAGQAMMGQFTVDAARAGIQVIVETHSDHVLNGIRRAVKAGRLSAEQVAIHFFRPRSDEGPQVLSPVLDDTGNIDDWPDGFFDQFDKDANYFAGWADV